MRLAMYRRDLLRLVPVLAVCLVTGAAHSVARAEDAGLATAVKATYLYKFAPFVRWPDMAQDGPFNICVVGNSDFGNLLDRAVAGQTVDGRTIVIRRYAAITGNPGCQVVYAAGSGTQSVAAILAVLRGQPVLTVTDQQTDPEATGIINFVINDNRIRFEISEAAAAANVLTISSKLLSLAVRNNDRG